MIYHPTHGEGGLDGPLTPSELQEIRAMAEARRQHEERGLYAEGKYLVQRLDGRDAPGEKHHGCDLFVLDVTHDPYATSALRAYALACRFTNPRLADDLLAWIAPQAESEG